MIMSSMRFFEHSTLFFIMFVYIMVRLFMRSCYIFFSHKTSSPIKEVALFCIKTLCYQNVKNRNIEIYRHLRLFTFTKPPPREPRPLGWEACQYHTLQIEVLRFIIVKLKSSVLMVSLTLSQEFNVSFWM